MKHDNLFLVEQDSNYCHEDTVSPLRAIWLTWAHYVLCGLREPTKGHVAHAGVQCSLHKLSFWIHLYHALLTIWKLELKMSMLQYSIWSHFCSMAGVPINLSSVCQFYECIISIHFEWLLLCFCFVFCIILSLRAAIYWLSQTGIYTKKSILLIRHSPTICVLFLNFGSERNSLSTNYAVYISLF